MLPLNQTPYLLGLFAQLHRAGISKVVLCISPFTASIRDEIRDGQEWGVDVTYSIDSGLYENADALWKARDLVTTPFMLCINGDTICNLNLQDFVVFHLKSGRAASLVGSRRTDQPHPGAVRVFGDLVADLMEKEQDMGPPLSKCESESDFANSGFYILERNRVDHLWPIAERQGKLEQGLLKSLAKIGELAVFDNGMNYLIDLGVPERVREATRNLRNISAFFEV